MSSVMRFDQWQDSNGNAVATGTGGVFSAPGSVLQVVSATKTDSFSTSMGGGTTISGAVTGLSVSITPTSASSKLLVMASINFSSSVVNGYAHTHIFRDGSASDFRGDAAGSRQRVATGLHRPAGTDSINFSAPIFLDDAGSTSATTYDVRLSHSSGGTQTVYVNRTQADADTTAQGRSASSIVVMEIAG